MEGKSGIHVIQKTKRKTVKTFSGKIKFSFIFCFISACVGSSPLSQPFFVGGGWGGRWNMSCNALPKKRSLIQPSQKANFALGS